MPREKGRDSNMARVITQLYEHTTRAALEAALATRELGYTDESGNESLSFKTNAGAYRRFPSLTLLARTSAAALIGFDPTGLGMAATTVQAALAELKAAGTGGTLTGGGTAGVVPLWTSALAQGDSVLSQASSKIIFSGDSVANLYRSGVGALATDGGLLVTGVLSGGGSAQFTKAVSLNFSLDFDNTTSDGAFATGISPSVTKNNGTTRTFTCLLIAPLLSTGGSNTTTTVNVLVVDPTPSTVTGLTTNLMLLRYGGTTKFSVLQDGRAVISGDSQARLIIYGLGDPLAANSESVELKHDGSTAYLAVRKSGTGAYRNFQILQNNAVAYELTAAGAHSFSGPLTINNLLGGQPLTVQVTGTELFGISAAGVPRLQGGGTTAGFTATMANSPKAGDPATWLNVSIIGGANGWIPFWAP